MVFRRKLETGTGASKCRDVSRRISHPTFQQDRIARASNLEPIKKFGKATVPQFVSLPGSWGRRATSRRFQTFQTGEA
jgi:hypothetical protein